MQFGIGKFIAISIFAIFGISSQNKTNNPIKTTYNTCWKCVPMLFSCAVNFHLERKKKKHQSLATLRSSLIKDINFHIIWHLLIWSDHWIWILNYLSTRQMSHAWMSSLNCVHSKFTYTRAFKTQLNVLRRNKYWSSSCCTHKTDENVYIQRKKNGRFRLNEFPFLLFFDRSFIWYAYKNEDSEKSI